MTLSLTNLRDCGVKAVGVCALIALAGCSQPIVIGGGGGASVASSASATQTRQSSAKDRLVGAIEANGCVLTADNVGAVVARASISNEQLGSLVSELEAEGRAEVAGSGAIRVLSDACT